MAVHGPEFKYKEAGFLPHLDEILIINKHNNNNNKNTPSTNPLHPPTQTTSSKL